MKLSAPLASVFLLAASPVAAPAQVCVPERQELRASDAEDGDLFGSSVALHGDTALIGAPGDDDRGSEAGAAYVFVHNGTGWVEQAKLLASDGAGFHAFGTSVAVRGDTLLVGAPGHGLGAGKAYVFVRQAGVWSEQATFAGGPAARTFGQAVALHGETAAIGAPALEGGTVGAVHVYIRQAGIWSLQAQLVDPTTGGLWAREFGKAVSLDQDALAVGVPSAHLAGNFSGGVAVYRRSAGSWMQEDLLVPQGAGYKHYFGSAVAIEGDRIVGGAPEQLYAGTGYVCVFELQGGSWNERAKIRCSDASDGDQFGASVALFGDAILAGAWRKFAAGPFSGAAYVHRLVGSDWYELARLRPADGGTLTEEYGRSVAMQGGYAFVGRPYSYDVGDSRGTAHVCLVPTAVGSTGCECGAGPCANPDPSAGCANSTGSGAGLAAIGETDPDRVTFLVSGALPKQFCAFFQSESSAAPLPFGDGLSCAGGGTLALNPLPRQLGADGTLVFGSCAGDTPISVLGGVVPGSGVTRFYQLRYRDPAGPCGSTFNLSNSVEIVW